MELEKLIRENLRNYNAYEPEEQPEGDGWVQLNSTDNAYPPIQEILD